jgi:small subunit ribosomal protein S6
LLANVWKKFIISPLSGCHIDGSPTRPKEQYMAFYESVLVFRQDLTEPQVKEKAAKFTEIIKELKGSVKSSEFWGLKNLAYIIRKNRKAHYVMFNMELPGDAVSEYERRLRIDEDTIRFLNVRVEELAKGQSIMMKKNAEEAE